jgi:hypothetical protein
MNFALLSVLHPSLINVAIFVRLLETLWKPGDTQSTQVIEGGGTRTLDLRIKSPLLYQLSYASATVAPGVAPAFFIMRTFTPLGQFKAADSDRRLVQFDGWHL